MFKLQIILCFNLIITAPTIITHIVLKKKGQYAILIAYQNIHHKQTIMIPIIIIPH
jgi:hypothetical protein